jgi:hypothetical protein
LNEKKGRLVAPLFLIDVVIRSATNSPTPPAERPTIRPTFLTASYTQISIVFPFIVISPAYFAGAVQLGGLMQTASAFKSVQAALSYFINAYRHLAEWRAVIARLEGFNLAVEKGWSAVRAEPAIQVRPQDQEWVKLDDLLVCLPQSKAACCRAWPPLARGRKRAGDRAIGSWQVDAVSGDCKELGPSGQALCPSRAGSSS